MGAVSANFPARARGIRGASFIPCASIGDAAPVRTISLGGATLFHVANSLRITDIAEDKSADSHARIPPNVYHV